MNRRRRAVLLQVRAHLEARDHERLCFMESTGLGADELLSVDLVQDPAVSWQAIRGADVYFIGGSGEYSARRDYPFTPRLTEIVEHLVDESIPLVGSCWGHHFLARVLGASLVTDRVRGEVGTFDIELNDRGAADPLFAGCPRTFSAHLGHHDLVESLPAEVHDLGSSERCGNQIIRVDGKPIYGTQFHSEMNEEHMKARLLMYRDSYLPDDVSVTTFERLLRPTPVVATLLRRFVELYA